MTGEEMERLKSSLEIERERLLKELGYLENRFRSQAAREASGDLSGYAHHQADAGTDTDEREKAAQITSAEGRLLEAVDGALDRIRRGTYGLCAICGGDIGLKRLEAMPYAILCIECKEREERKAPASR